MSRLTIRCCGCCGWGFAKETVRKSLHNSNRKIRFTANVRPTSVTRSSLPLVACWRMDMSVIASKGSETR